MQEIITTLLRMLAVASVSLAAVATPVHAGEPDASPCAEAAFAASGAFETFNRRQCARAAAPLRTVLPQEGDTCVCEALLNAAFELGVHGTMEELAAQIGCSNRHFGDVFNGIARQDTALAGRVFGGAGGAWASKSLISTDEALRQIVQALSDGHVVAVALNARPIYDRIKELTGVPYSGLSVTGAHALVVRSVIKDRGGNATHFIVVDSSGPQRLYSVPVKVFRKAYGSLLAKASRGVYVSRGVRVL